MAGRFQTKMNPFKTFAQTKEGMLAQFAYRKSRRVRISMFGTEPQSKRMNATDRAAFQTEVAQQLTDAKRSTFTGLVALNIDLSTSSKNPPQAHTIAKNLLDLLSARLEGVKWPRKHLLYKDDSQVQALSVFCRHGESQPHIFIEARPFNAMLNDLEVGSEAMREQAMNGDDRYSDDRDEDWIDTLRDLLDDEAKSRERLGDKTYEGFLKLARWSAQLALLRRSGVTVPVLSWLYGRPKNSFGVDYTQMWAGMISRSKLRLQVGELPITPGSSGVFKQAIATEIAAFKARWDWVLSPLVVAVGLEVVVRPNPATPSGVLHDLDNIVRDYLLPQVVPKFGTVSDLRWTIDYDEPRQRDPKLASAWGPRPTPPISTKFGITRYEVWRLPPVAGEKGFVSVALFADMNGKGDLMEQLDDVVRHWKEDSRRRR